MPSSRDAVAKSLTPTALSAAEIAAFQAVDLSEQKQTIGLTIVTVAGLLLAGFAAWE